MRSKCTWYKNFTIQHVKLPVKFFVILVPLDRYQFVKANVVITWHRCKVSDINYCGHGYCDLIIRCNPLTFYNKSRMYEYKLRFVLTKIIHFSTIYEVLLITALIRFGTLHDNNNNNELDCRLVRVNSWINYWLVWL